MFFNTISLRGVGLFAVLELSLLEVEVWRLAFCEGSYTSGTWFPKSGRAFIFGKKEPSLSRGWLLRARRVLSG